MKRLVRPGKPNPPPLAVDVGALIEQPRRHVWLQHRDGVIVHGPTGAGKTWRVAWQRVIDAPGFVLATTTKADLVAATLLDRAARGAVAVFDPEHLTGWPDGIAWSILTGCTDPDTAIRRADALARAMPLEGTRNGAYFEQKAATMLRCCLHAAALRGLSIREVRVWVSARTNHTPVDILADTLPDWASELDQILSSASESSDDVLAAASRLLEPLASPTLLAAVDVPAEQSFDVGEFVLSGANTLYLVSRGTTRSMAPFVAALAAEVHYVADRASQLLPGKRLDPPVRLVLDEMNNVAPIPDLPQIMTDSGGKGITVWAFAHNQDQNELRWGAEGGKVLAQSAPAMLILPGLRGVEELSALSRLIGERRRWEASLHEGSRSYALHDDTVLRTDEIRELGTDHGLLIYRNAPAMLLRLPSVWERRTWREAVTASTRAFDDIVAGRRPPPGDHQISPPREKEGGDCDE
ncbi:type IV secretory system conjugative DNA transfer family protein [Nocardia sp. NBC_01327]|uniref:type IV secretory system conjugative DNA transfer family protein n=1 Tax=Nocardia sp. NBC_01327 TaxID=2903593 RepID=UPI002E12F243|nr:TraM recognition domain-containing protein [Nocardia sp. NBC_01327]WSJ18631.1 TraM recognition domain-containing protein [Nocardia sp. NBC_01327]